jgi:hypothetical protein
MRRTAAILLLLLATGCRYYEAGKRAAAVAVVTSVMHIQASAPLTQSAAHPVAPDRDRRLVASTEIVRCPLTGRSSTIIRISDYIVVTPHDS